MSLESHAKPNGVLPILRCCLLGHDWQRCDCGCELDWCARCDAPRQLKTR